MTWYSAVVCNPLSAVAWTNEPVGIKVEFAQGECVTADHITVYNPAGSAVPFQWESAVNPHDVYSGTSTDPNIETDQGTWTDGSLRAGTIWIMVPSISAGATLRYRIGVFDAAQGHSYSQGVTYALVSTNDQFTISGGVKFSFESSQAYNLRRMYDFSGSLGGADYFQGTNGLFASMTANGVTYNSYTSAHVQTVTHAIRNSSAFGYGVVFQDYETKWNWVNETGLWTRMRYRIWANSRIDVEMYTWTTGALASNTRKLVIGTAFGNTASITNHTDYGVISASSGAMRATVAAIAVVKGFEATPQTSFSGTQIDFSTATPTVGLSSSAVSAPTGGYWTSRQRISTTSIYASGDDANEWLRLRNRIITRATRRAMPELRAEFVARSQALSGQFLDWFKTYGTAASWTGCAAAVTLFDGYFRGIDRYADAAALFTTWLASRTNAATGQPWTGTTADFLDGWRSGTTGYEFSGRNIQGAWFLYLDCIRRGRTAEAQTWRQYILNYADFVIESEKESAGGVYTIGGGTPDGNVLLRGDAPDAFNAEGAAMLHLARALTLGANATYSAALTRIATRFAAGVLAGNWQPYTQGNSTVSQPAYHYMMFSYTLALAASKAAPSLTWTWHPRTPAGVIIQPLGYPLERIATDDPARRGAVSTSWFTAAALALAPDVNESDMEEANMLLRFTSSRSTPGLTYPFETPLDGYTYTGAGGQEMDSQFLCMAALALSGA